MSDDAVTATLTFSESVIRGHDGRDLRNSTRTAVGGTDKVLSYASGMTAITAC